MSQVPLAPPPPTGGPLDGWLFLLWQRLTQAGQILWGSITPGTSADVAATVTDETGTAGSLVFSGNPTLQGLNVTTAAFTSRGITDNATATALTIDSNGDVGLGSPPIFGRRFLIAGAGTSVAFDFLRTDTPTNTQSICGIDAYADDGSTEFAGGTMNWRASENWSATNHGTDLQIRLVASGSGKTLAEVARIKHDGTAYLGGAEASPALKVTPVASQARWIEVTGATSSTDPTIGTSGGNLACSTVFMPKQATTAGAPAYVLGGMYFDTTLNKLRIGGATAWETVTSV